MKEIRLAEVLAQAKFPGTTMIPATQRCEPCWPQARRQGAARVFMSWTWSAIRAWPSSPDSTPCPGCLLPGQLQLPRGPPGLCPPHGGVVRRGAPGGAATRRFHRPRFPRRAGQYPGRAAGKHYLSSRSRSQQSVLVFLARDASARVLCYAHAGVAKAIRRPRRCSASPTSGRSRTGQPPAELVFDSQLTTYEQLHQLKSVPRHQLP